MSSKTQQRVVRQRRQRPFKDPHDLFSRVRPHEDEARALIHCGALDNLAAGTSRAQLLWQLARWQRRRPDKNKAPSLFDPPNEATAPPVLPPDDPRERLRREFKVLDFLCSQHPMTLFEPAVRKARTVKAINLPGSLGKRVRFAGWLITGKVVHTRGGDPMEFLTFEDETGIVETTFFPQAYNRFCHLLNRGRPYLLEGVVEQNWGATTLTVNGVTAFG